MVKEIMSIYHHVDRDRVFEYDRDFNCVYDRVEKFYCIWACKLNDIILYIS
jgi:hypothetical protein